jgi:hypothetical protein
MNRYVVRVELEPSPEVVSTLAAASMTVEETVCGEPAANVTVDFDAAVPGDDATLTQLLDALSPPGAQAMTVAVNAPSRSEAIAKLREALSRWGDIPAEVVDEEPL